MKGIWKLIFEILPTWLAIASVATILSLLVYASVQQNYRQSANDPQIQIAEDLAQSLSTGTMSTASFGPLPKIDIGKSLSPFLIIYDKDGKVIAGNASIDGETPTVSKGVLDHAQKAGENRVTWEPKKDIRNAIVVVPFKGSNEGFVIIGRSLREVEKRENRLSLFVLLA